VKSGHFVRVKPTPLRNPRVALYSAAMVGNLGIAEDDVVGSTRFAKFFSGDADAVPGMDTWATPYALSIMGKRQFQNCPFGNGNGYGDGRAVSVGEVLGTRKGDDGDLTETQRWEMQLKGGGPTPFCRGADGRAVLRSSIREFLASEAMFHLGVDTTRALSLVVSDPPGDVVRRPWYDPNVTQKPAPNISMDDPRLSRFPDDIKTANNRAGEKRQTRPRRDDRRDVRHHHARRAELLSNRTRGFIRSQSFSARPGLGRAFTARADGTARGVPGIPRVIR
jgi:hypothetical protein